MGYTAECWIRYSHRLHLYFTDLCHEMHQSDQVVIHNLCIELQVERKDVSWSHCYQQYTDNMEQAQHARSSIHQTICHSQLTHFRPSWTWLLTYWHPTSHLLVTHRSSKTNWSQDEGRTSTDLSRLIYLLLYYALPLRWGH